MDGRARPIAQIFPLSPPAGGMALALLGATVDKQGVHMQPVRCAPMAAMESRTGGEPRSAFVRPIRPLRTVDALLQWLLRRAGLADARLRLLLADGTELSPGGPGAEVARVIFRDRRTALAVLRDPDSGFGEAYTAGHVAVEGDLVAALEEAYRAVTGTGRARSVSRRGHSPRAAHRNARRHYDLGNDFYRLWLDEQMVYTCAYYSSAEATLEQAQAAKMERVCAKLGLVAGERVVEAGCGWGALALHMARHHGVRVTAYNVSGEQVRFARARARAEGLQHRVDFVEDDYRRISGRYDAFVSVGMLEHVGPRDYGTLGEVIRRTLDPERGRGLLHFIGRDHPWPLNPWIRRWIFPGAHPPTLAEAVAGVLEPAGLAVLDVENLRAHYARTLAHWRERFEGAADRVQDLLGARATRAWRLYLAGSEASFRTGWLELFQVVFGAPAEGLRWRRL